MSRKVIIEDIARQSGTSVSTVSLVLRNKPGIGLETRRRVLDVAQALGYQRRSPVAPAASQATLNIGLILRVRNRSRDAGPSAVNPFYSWVLAGIDAAARQQRLNLLYASLPVDDDNRPLELPHHLLEQSLDGLLLIGAFTDETIAAIVGVRSTPVILVDTAARAYRYDAIVSDNQGGAYAAVTHLIDRGHRHIALAGPRRWADPVFSQRREGYLRAIRQHGLADYVLAVDTAAERRAAGAVGSLRDHRELTAIFGCNDAIAIAALRGAQALGRRIPEELSVIGFDDIELSAQTTPALTTMAVDKLSMGLLGVQFLRHRLAWPDAAPTLTLLTARLIERGSVAALTN